MFNQLRESTPRHELDIVELDIVDRVWDQKDLFVRWPKRPLLFMPGTIRLKSGEFYQYTPEQKQQLREAGVMPDRRSNGPAIMAYRLAGGERPTRRPTRVTLAKEWNIHHIYDSKFPAPGKKDTVHAVKDGRYFTEASGLVAIHPIGDALADEVPYFAWLLRREAFQRFGFDPDSVFREPPG